MRPDSLQYANLADHCYDHNDELAKLAGATDPIRIDGVEYWVLKHVDNPRNGYQGTTYQHVQSGAIVVAHRGTEPDRELFQDIVLADAGMVATRRNIQSNDAIELARWALEYAEREGHKPGKHSPEVTVTGHSLGGTLAQITAHHFGLRGETFNAYGAVSLNRRIPEGGDAVINHVVAADVISAASAHYGQVRLYAAPAHIAALRGAGYENNRQAFDLHHPLPVLPKALDFHGMHNFRNVDSHNRLDVSLLRDPQAQPLAATYDPMIDKYRGDVRTLRTSASLGGDVVGTLRHGPALAPLYGLERLRETLQHDLAPGHPAQREADHRPSLPGHPLGERLRDNGHATSLPDHLLPGAPSGSGLELPDYLRPAPTVGHSAPMPSTAQAAAPAMHAPPLRSGHTFASQHHDIPAPPAEPAALPSLPTAQTIEAGDRGAAVEAMQRHLRLLGATDRYGQKIEADRDYGDRTRDAVEQFQLWTGREPTGIADPDTLKALQSQAQFAVRQRAQGIAISPEAHLTEQLTPVAPQRTDAAIERPLQGREQAGLTPFSDPHHPQHALYTDVQQRFQAKGHDLSEAQLSALTGQMHLGGYKPGWPGDVIVYQGKAVVGSEYLTHQTMSVELNASTPSVQETMTTFQAEQQSLAQGMEALRQQQAMSQGHGLAR